MNFQFQPYPRRLRLAFFSAALLLALPGVAPGNELEPAQTLEGFPFLGAVSAALSADGRHLYAGGTVSYYAEPTVGLVWLGRDPTSGDLDFHRNFSNTTGVLGLVLGRDDLFLYALRPGDVAAYRRDSDGALSSHVFVDLPASWRPERIFATPSRDQLVVLGRPGDSPTRVQALFFDLDANGVPALAQTLEAGFRFDSLAVLADDLLVSGRVLLRRSGGLWTVQEIPGFAADAKLSARLVSADRRYLYATAGRGSVPGIYTELVTLEEVGGVWTAVAAITLNGVFDREITTLSLHPTNGDLYLASYDTNGGSSARIDHFRSQESGRRFVAARQLQDAASLGYARTAKHLLAFTPDGRDLYTNFGGEPLARLAVDPADGSLAPVANAAGRYSHFERLSRLLAMPSGDVYVMTPSAVLQTRWEDGGARVVTALDPTSWPSGRHQSWRDLVLTPGGGAGVLTEGTNVVMVERAPQTGALRALDDTTVPAAGGCQRLILSPDGRYVYCLGFDRIAVYYLRRDVPKLVLAQEFPQRAAAMRIAPNGRDVAAIDGAGKAVYLSRDIESGELAAASGPLRGGLTDALFLPDGRLTWIGLRNDPVQGTFEVFRRKSGAWVAELAKTFAAAAGARQVFDSYGHYVFVLQGGHLDQLAYTPQFDSLVWVGGVGAARPVDPAQSSQIPDLILLPGEEGLLVSDSANGIVRRFGRGCGNLYAGPCLAGQRFRTELIWHTSERQGPAVPLTIGSEDSQVFSFFDSANWEMLVKVLDGCALNGRFWVFAAASTDLGYDLVVSDTWTGQRKVYRNAGGAPAPAITDSNAFPTCEAASPGWNAPIHSRQPLAENPNGLRLGPDYEATVTWTTAAGLTGQGRGFETIPAQASGLFYFFDRQNWEMQVKVLDGCAINGHRWVFGAATTDVGYTLEVTERATGRRLTYQNRVGNPSKAITDIEAFPCD